MSNLEKVKKFIPYGTDPEKDKMVRSVNWEDLRKMVKEGYGVDALINDKDDAVDKKHNKDLQVQKAMAEKGYDSDDLVKDDVPKKSKDASINNEDLQVQKAVAKKGYGLDNLVKDDIPEEFKATVESFISLTFDLPLNTFLSLSEGKRERKNIYNTCDNLIANRIGIDEFITSERAEPRGMVAEHGIALDVLINDEDYDVRKTVLDYLKTRSMTLSQWANYEEKSLDLNELLNSPYAEVRLEAFRCVYRDSIDNLKNVGFPIDFKDMEDVKDHIFNNPTTCIKALRFLGDESVKSDEKYKEVLSILVSKSEELKEDHTSFPEKFNSFIKNGPYSVFKDFEKVRNGSLDINDPSISRFNTMKLEIQNLRNQISILTKDNKSLQKTLEKYVSVEKETDEKEL